MRALLAVVSAVIAAVVLAACGGDDDTGASTSAGGASTSAEPRTLTVWDFGASYGLNAEQQKQFVAMIDELNERFEQANPGVTVSSRHLSYGDFATKIPAAVAAGNAPDVAWDYTDGLWRYTVPIDDLLSDEQRETITLLDQSIASAKDGRLHIMPWGTYQGVWMYNRAIFEKNGIEVPTTQEEFLAVCDKLNQAGVVPIRATFGGQYTMNRYVALLAGQLMPDIAAWNAQEVPFTSPEYRAGVDAFMDMTEHDCWGPNPESKGVDGEGDQMFRSGKTAIQYALAPPDVEDLEGSIGAGNLGLFLQPALPGGSPSMDAALNSGFTIIRTSDQQDLAWDYVSFLAEPAQQELAWEKIRQVPNSTEVELTSDEPVYQQMLDWARDPQFQVGAWPVNAEEFQVWDQLTPDVITGRVSVDELLDRLQDAREKTKGAS